MDSSAYGFSKFMAELVVAKYCKNYTNLRCCAIIGPGMKKGLIHDIKHGGPIYIRHDSRLQFITAEEVANVIDYIISDTNQIRWIGMKYVVGEGNVSPEEIEKAYGLNFLYPTDAQRQHYNHSHNIFGFKMKKSFEYVKGALDG